MNDLSERLGLIIAFIILALAITLGVLSIPFVARIFTEVAQIAFCSDALDFHADGKDQYYCDEEL